jgi:hypothetical protein
LAFTHLRVFPFAFTAAFACVLISGCHVSTNKNGKNDNVDIGTPFGSMSVKTNDSANTSDIGLAIYPGSVAVKDKDDDNSADVNLSFGKFHLGVKAASFQTSDSQDKVLGFYRKDMARYGTVIECRGKATVGKPERTTEGLTCSEENKNHINASDSSDNLELRAGSPQHQHIVGVENKNGGTRIGLVMLDLPSDHDTKTVE